MLWAKFQKNEHSPVAIELYDSTNTPKHRRDCAVFHGTIPKERHAVLRPRTDTTDREALFSGL